MYGVYVRIIGLDSPSEVPRLRVYGGYRERLGPYRVTIDGKQYEHTGYNKSDPENPNAVLFNSKGLKFKEHNMEIVNVGQDDTRPYGVFDISHVRRHGLS